jgi:cyclopropane-fatty-acyl-phospholipid synthase
VIMLQKKFREWVTRIGQEANIHARFILWDGQQLDFGRSSAPPVTLHIKDPSFIKDLISPNMSKLGEAYVRGKIDFEGKISDIIDVGFSLVRTIGNSKLRFLSQYFPHTRQSDKQSIQFHYDVSNAFYQLWLDPNMVYSCAYFEQGDESLELAQQKKIDHILTKIQLQPNQTLLDIGCGWGALVIRAAQQFQAKCVGITLSENQYALASERVKAAGLEDRVEIRLQDYRDIKGQFDRITSVGMFEHVGRKHLVDYFRIMHDLLKDDGIAMNHGITSVSTDMADANLGAGEFIDRYIFPNGELPHVGQAIIAMQQGGLEVFDVENLRRHYARTLSIWADNFEANAAQVQQHIDEERYRAWRLYLAGCAYSFKHDQMSIYQLVCHKAGRLGDALPWSRRYIYQ